nr:VOC family protein [Paracoccus sp. (in: a-proteobacteria)]
MAGFHGKPCWYELTTSKGNLAAAGDFYGAVLGWSIRDAGMDDFSYHLASAGDDRVAGLMEMPPDVSQMPPNWLIYFAVEDADGAAADIIA